MRHKVFAWLMLLDRINTRDLLQRRHFNVGEDHNCPLCEHAILETNNHLLYECPFAIRCWVILGIEWDNLLDMQARHDQAKER